MSSSQSSCRHPSVYVINMDRDTTRLASFRKNQEEAGTDISRIVRRAVVGKALSDDDLRRHVAPEYRLWSIPSIVGASLSHRLAWEHALQTLPAVTEFSEIQSQQQQQRRHWSEDWLAVFEDDAVMSPDAWSVLDGWMQRHSDQTRRADVILLGYFATAHPDHSRPTATESLTNALRFLGSDGSRRKALSDEAFVPDGFAGMHAYLVSRKGAERLLQVFPKVTGYPDVTMSREACRGNLDVVAVHPPLAHQAYEEASHTSSSRPYLLNSVVKRWRYSEDPTSPTLDTCLGYRFVRIGPYHGSHATLQPWHGFYALFGAVAGLALGFSVRAVFGLIAAWAVLLLLVDPLFRHFSAPNSSRIPWPTIPESLIDTFTFSFGVCVGAFFRRLAFSSGARRLAVV